MLESVRGYLISVVAVSMIAVVGQQMVQKESLKRVLRLVSGLLVILVVIAPLARLDEKDLEGMLDYAGEELLTDTDDIDVAVHKTLMEHVQATAEEYVEKKAASLGATVQARVVVTDEEYPVPYSVRLIGTMSVSQQLDLSVYLSQDLGIPASRQEWDLYG